jgi:hypothetical protein
MCALLTTTTFVVAKSIRWGDFNATGSRLDFQRPKLVVPLSLILSFLVVIFRSDLSGQRLVSWNALLKCLTNVYLQTGCDEFHQNLYKIDKFWADSMYNRLIQPDGPINKNKLWKFKILLRIKVFRWYLC